MIVSVTQSECYRKVCSIEIVFVVVVVAVVFLPAGCASLSGIVDTETSGLSLALALESTLCSAISATAGWLDG